MKNIMKEAHNLTKRIIRKGDSYKATFRICLSFVHSQVKKGVNGMIELKGSEKQVKYANDIKANLITTMNKAIESIEDNQLERGKRSKRADRIANQLRDEIKLINTMLEAKEIIETYKNLFNERVDTFMNSYVSDLKKSQNR